MAARAPPAGNTPRESNGWWGFGDLKAAYAKYEADPTAADVSTGVPRPPETAPIKPWGGPGTVHLGPSNVRPSRDPLSVDWATPALGRLPSDVCPGPLRTRVGWLPPRPRAADGRPGRRLPRPVQGLPRRGRCEARLALECGGVLRRPPPKPNRLQGPQPRRIRPSKAHAPRHLRMRGKGQATFNLPRRLIYRVA
ncbi:hypothetical protein M885DRAFT_44256 [Pelagophyceae sp. CCMP2097]|nr:hypothetical protein M885DRAFT_44256 [Pelagophyceae sp. CCMP2097]